MKSDLKQPSDSWVYEAAQMSGLGWKVKGQLNIWYLYKNIVSL